MPYWRFSSCARFSIFKAKGVDIRLGSNAYSTIANLHKILASQTTEVTVKGFVNSIRRQKQKCFASIGDGSTLKPLQAILSPAQAQSLTNGAAVRLTGSWRPSPYPEAQIHELHVDHVEILGSSDSATFPLQKQSLPNEILRLIPHMRSRLPYRSLLLRFRSRAIAEVSSFFAEQEFIQTHTPIITSTDCEGSGEVFQIDRRLSGNDKPEESSESFFKSPKYLTVSAQLHLEALAQSVGNVWTLSPSFRAERSETSRHQSEFYMLEAEMNFIESLDPVLDLVENMIRSLTRSLFKSTEGQEILHGRLGYETDADVSSRSKNLSSRWEGITTSKPWPRITYTTAISLLQDADNTERFTISPKWGSDLLTEHERYISKIVGQDSPVFVTEYPKAIKPFYMLPCINKEDTVQCFDLLVPEICELAGGSLREHRLHNLVESMRRTGIIPRGSNTPTDEELGSLKWYVDLRRWGSVPHGGFGLGFDRLLAYLAGVQNIREIVAFPRWIGRCEC